MTLKDIFAKAPAINCASLDDLSTARDKLLSGIADLAVCDAATIGYIDAKGEYYCPDLEWVGNRDSLDMVSLRAICLEYTKQSRYADVAFPIQLAWICGKNDKYI